jgi:1-pyrroline-5-carboxylate dehydrogenase
MMLSRLSTLRAKRTISTIPSWATLDPLSLGTSTTPHAVSNLVSGNWTPSKQTLTIPNPMDRDAPAVCTVPDTTVEELTPFVESLRGVPKSGVHNPLKNVERYLMFGEISRKVRYCVYGSCGMVGMLCLLIVCTLIQCGTV